MQEFSVLSYALNQLIFQIPVLLTALVGLFFLIQKQDSLGVAKTPAFIGLVLILALSLLGPFYQGWITKLAVQQGVRANSSLFALSSIATNVLWAVSIISLLAGVFLGRNQGSSGGNSV